jgi:hypothetical protein
MIREAGWNNRSAEADPTWPLRSRVRFSGPVTDSQERHTTRFTWATCGKEHDLSEVSFGSDAPAQWDALSAAERERSEFDQETCIIALETEDAFFVRASLDVPIRQSDRSFTWGVWVSLSEKSFGEMIDHWNDRGRLRYGPYFGWLCTQIPVYPDTMFLKTGVHQRAVGMRPSIELEQTDHPLSIHQREGIEPDELRGMVMRLLHEPAK